jgi:PAS domain-containing protein
MPICSDWGKKQLLNMLKSVDDTGAHFETRHRRKDGTVYDVEISTNGAVLFCVCRDITERITEQKRIEEALLLTQFSFDKASIEDVNEQACKKLGYSREELCKMSIYDVDPSLSIQGRKELWKRAKKEQDVHRAQK